MIPDILQSAARNASDRIEPCRICGHTRGFVIGKVAYWNLLQASLMGCPACRLIQLDPMPDPGQTAAGCTAYYLLELQETSAHEMVRNRIRNFRRGILFAHSLKRKGFRPDTLLEAGPGSGYFAAGIQTVFPGLRITVLDINEEVLSFNRTHHGFETRQGIPEQYDPELVNRFDLVVARDLLEHVTDVAASIRNFRTSLTSGGLFHFITPNGREDVWKHYLTWTIRGEPSELLINHVNYFDGQGLCDFLTREGFAKQQYYTYGLKPFLRGQGWRTRATLQAPVSVDRPPVFSPDPNRRHDDRPLPSREETLDLWYLHPDRPTIAHILSLYHHANRVRLNPARNIGHEIHGLFRKV